MPQNNESPHFGLEIRNWQENPEERKGPADLETIAHQVVCFFREARKAPLQNRINPIAISLKEFSHLVKPNSDLSTNIATTAIYEWAKQDPPSIKIWTETNPPAVEEILEAIYCFRDSNPESIMIWISPKGRVYVEARINVYQTIEVNGSKYLFFWGIPSPHSDEECLEFSHKLLPYIKGEKTLYFTNDVEELRINPLPLWVPAARSLTTFLNQQISLPEAWQAIASGQPIIDTLRELPEGKALVLERYEKIINAKTEAERRWVGSDLELAGQRRLNIALRRNAHGALYSSLFSDIPDFSFLDETGRLPQTTENLGSEKRIHCGGCGRYEKGTEFKPSEHCPPRGTS